MLLVIIKTQLKVAQPSILNNSTLCIIMRENKNHQFIHTESCINQKYIRNHTVKYTYTFIPIIFNQSNHTNNTIQLYVNKMNL